LIQLGFHFSLNFFSIIHITYSKLFYHISVTYILYPIKKKHEHQQSISLGSRWTSIVAKLSNYTNYFPFCFM